jgi:histidinol dehydrogenase
VAALLNRLDLRGSADPAADLPRPADGGGDEPIDAVRQIVAEVRARGDDAVLDLTERFDGVRLATSRVGADEIAAALDAVPDRVADALVDAADAVRSYHESQVAPSHRWARRGVEVRSRTVPVGRAGCYVPGGRAAYPSTVLMTAIPARVAGVAEVVLCVPPNRATGTVALPTLAAAAVADVDEVWAIGGAQAIAAMAYGTESIRPVDVIAGPGNLFVAVAKQEVAGDVGVAAAFAGPSEVVVIADGTAPAAFAAVDVLVQAEHGPDGLAWFITWDEAVADEVSRQIELLVAAAPRRAEIEATLARSGWMVLVDGPDAALAVSDAVAPEHLQLMCAGADALADRVRNAGAVFCGPWSPAAVGDYAAGPSHVLPTHGSARFGSALTVADFTKQVHVVTLDHQAFEGIAPTVEALADAEGLGVHGDAVRIRLDRGPAL